MVMNEPDLQITTNPAEAINKPQSTLSIGSRIKESLVNLLVGLVPARSVGVKLRSFLYGTVLARIGHSVYIENGAELSGFSNIEIGDNVCIPRNVCLEARGHSNNRIIIGSGVTLGRGVRLVGLENSKIEVGDRTFMNSDVWINGPGNITIGQDCLIGPRVGIIAVNHIFGDATRSINIQGHTSKGIVIEDDCWLAFGVVVVDGVTIGKGSVIGAGAVVTKDIPPYSIAVGVPAKVVGQRQG